MKPLKLTMNAFNAFAHEQTIDFAELGTTGLYLITGETGSGKTTIFDAISFAFFGKASGSGRDDYAMLRSDFAEDNTRTFVELDFVSGNDRYTIKRTIKKISHDKTTQEVILTLPDGTTQSGDRNIRPKIIDILGLDRDQFTQIVMIAQNDFLRFLQSGTEERVKILRRIFGTEKLRKFQDFLKVLTKTASDERDQIIRDFDRYNINVYKRDEQFAQWDAETTAAQTELATLDHRLAEYDQIKQTLAVDIALAEELNSKFAHLRSCQDALEAHQTQSHTIAAIRDRVARGETALRKVKPHADEAAKVSANHRASQANLAAAQEQQRTTFAALEQITADIRALPPLAEAQTSFASLSDTWATATERLKILKDLQADRREILNKQTTLAKERAKLAAALEILDKLPPLDESQTHLAHLTQELNTRQETSGKLAVLRSDLAMIQDRQETLALAQTEFTDLCARFETANSQYMILEEAFLRNQAGLLATSLSEGDPCPVCGSTTHPAPASLSEGGITETKLKKARETKEKAQAGRETKSAECGRQTAEIETLTKRFYQDLAVLGGFPASSEQVRSAGQPQQADLTERISLTEPDCLADLSARLAENAQTLQTAIDDITAQKTAAQRTLAQINTNFTQATQLKDELTPKISLLQGTTGTLIERFHKDYSDLPSRDILFVDMPGQPGTLRTSQRLTPEALWTLSETTLPEDIKRTQEDVDTLSLRKEAEEKILSELRLAWETATKQRTAADAAYKSAQTLVAERTNHEQNLSILRDQAQTQFHKALRAHGFVEKATPETPDTNNLVPNPAQYTAALVNETELTALAKQITDYEKTGDQLTRDIKRLESETAGRRHPDLTELRNQFEAAQTASTMLSQQRDETRNQLEKTGNALKDLRRTAIEFEKAEKSYADIKQLSDTANGKLDFETYTQVAYFDHVLRAANIRLTLMSQNRYTLRRKEETTDKRSKTGLEIEVLDAYTGKARSANSLSGGESFMASLSLALGLSDIVQQNAGGIHLDTMFIDEGFGSLDTDILDLAIRTLSELAGTNRIIGVISHVPELRERIDKQIQVEKTTGGSKITLVG
ncbi:MAG: SMC family ATPase [Peptococcaceae bacterium]|nr:SMC family ATPase [Peptococcaceae bacterium]